MLALYSHLDDGMLGPAMVDSPLIMVSALSAVGSGRAYREKKRMEEAERKRKMEAGRVAR